MTLAAPSIPIDASRILDEVQEPVRRFLRRLLRTEDEQAEAVSKTLLVLLERLRGGGQVDDPVAFALGTAWKIARKSPRALDARRRVLDEPVARTFDPGRAVEIREWLLEAMATLPVEDRAILFLRFDQDLSYREIAQVLGIGTGLAGWRLHRARAALKRALAESGDGDFVTAALALFPEFCGGRTAGAVAGGATSSPVRVGSAIATRMPRGVAALLALGALGALGSVGFLILESETAFRTPLPSSAARQEIVASRSVGERNAPGEIASVPFVDAGRPPWVSEGGGLASSPGLVPAVLEGTIRDPERQPIEGAELKVVDAEGRPLAATTTMADGSYRLVVDRKYFVRVGDAGILSVRKAGLCSAMLLIGVAVPDGFDGALTRYRLDTRLDRGQRLQGTVRSARTRKPLAGAVIRVGGPDAWLMPLLGDLPAPKPDRGFVVGEATTGADGVFVLDALPFPPAGRTSCPPTLVTVEARGHAAAFATFTGPASPVTGLEISLEPAVTAIGRVTEADGTPVPRARVALQGVAEPPSQGPSDAAPDREEEVLPRFRTAMERVAISDESGEYLLRGIPKPPRDSRPPRVADDRPDRLVARPRGDIPVPCDAARPSGGEEIVMVPELIVEVAPRFVFPYRIVDSAGNPVVGAEILLGSGPRPELATMSLAGRSDATGHAVISSPDACRPPEWATVAMEALPERTIFMMEMRALGFANVVIEDVVPVPIAGKVEAMTVVMEPERAAEGVVVDVDGRPVEGARVALAPPVVRKNGKLEWVSAPRVVAPVFTQRDGRFRIRGLGKGPATIRATLPPERGGPPLFGSRGVGPYPEASAGPFEGEIPRLVLRLPIEVRNSMGTLRLDVSAAKGGLPVDGPVAAVLYRDRTEVAFGFMTGKGQVGFDGVPSGDYELRLVANGFAPTTTRVKLPAATVVDEAVTLAPECVLRGSVTPSPSCPLDSLVVVVASTDGRDRRREPVDATGHFAVRSLGRGEWLVQATSRAASRRAFHASAVAVVSIGDETEIELPPLGGGAFAEETPIRIGGMASDLGRLRVKVHRGSRELLFDSSLVPVSRFSRGGDDLLLIAPLPAGACTVEVLLAGAVHRRVDAVAPEGVTIE